MNADLRLGRWQDVLADVECDALIADAPYSARVHAGHDAVAGIKGVAELGYFSLDADGVAEVVSHWAPRTRGWMCSITSHDLVTAWESCMNEAGRYTFAPIPVIDRGSRPRLLGDGPANWTAWLVVSRPKSTEFARWGALPGCYLRSPGDDRGEHRGGKPLGVMRAIVRDYSRRGDVVCDPFAGGATTLLAALMEGREAVGSECDPNAHADAVIRLARGYTRDLFGGAS